MHRIDTNMRFNQSFASMKREAEIMAKAADQPIGGFLKIA